MNTHHTCHVCGRPTKKETRHRNITLQCTACRKLNVPGKQAQIIAKVCKRHGVSLAQLQAGPITKEVCEALRAIQGHSEYLTNRLALEEYCGIKSTRVNDVYAKARRI